MEAVVEFDYTAEHADELTIRKGDTITNVGPAESGWLKGSLRGKRGVFPDNFVKVIVKETKKVPASGKEGNVTHRTGAGRRRCKVLFSYAPTNEDELELTVDDEIEVLEEVEDGWWKGRHKEKVGVFPSNFVVEMKDTDHKVSNLTKSSGTEKKDSKTKHTNGESKTKLPVKDTPSSSSTAGGKSATGKGKSGGGRTQIPKNSSSAAIKETVPQLPPKRVREQVRAIYSYVAQNDDELSLHVGDVVTVVSKDSEDKGWWKGEANGRTGVFPDNFVEIITPEPSLPKKPERPPKDEVSVKVASGSQPSQADKAAAPPIPTSTKPSHVKDKESSPKSPAVRDKESSQKSSAVHASKVPEKSSKETKNNSYSEELDAVERNSERLSHPTADRVRAPVRRPPSMAILREDEINGVPNGLPRANGLPAEDGIQDKSTSISPWAKDIQQIQNKKEGDGPMDSQRGKQLAGGIPVLPVKPNTERDTVKFKTNRPAPSAPAKSPSVSPTPNRSSSGGDGTDDVTSSAPVDELSESYEDLKKDYISLKQQFESQVKSLEDSLETMRLEFNKKLRLLVDEVDEEKQMRVAMEVQLQRVVKLVKDTNFSI